MLAHAIEKGFHLQIIGREPRYLVTGEQIVSPRLPHPVPATLQRRLGWLMRGIRPKLGKQAVHRLAYRLTCSRTCCFRPVIGRVVQTGGDAAKLGVRRTDVVCHCLIDIERAIQLGEHAAEIRCFRIARELMQRLRHRIQLLIAGQSTPGKGVATGAVHGVTNRLPYLLFDCNQLGITRQGDKGGTDALLCVVGVGGLLASGTAAKAPNSSRRCCRNRASTSSAGLATLLRKCS